MDCIFCKIINKDIPSSVVYEDELIYAFKDINPEAPVHVLVVPKEHIPSAMELQEGKENLIGHIMLMCKKLAVDLGISESGFRIVNNCGVDGGQTVDHLHFHLLGGRHLKWPPG